jgi:serine/threonine-protein kinase
VSYEASETAPESQVTDQDPNRDQYVDPGSSIDITVSSGLPMVDVPFVVGASQDEARNRLRNAKLDPAFTSVESDEPQGQVLSTDPEGGSSVPQGTTVTVTISKGPHEVPNVVGLNRSDAIKKIVDAGFEYDIRGDDKSTEPRGTVTDQIPKDGTLPQGSTVTLFVSTYEPPPPPPTEPTTPPPTEPPPTLLPTPTPSAEAPPRAGTRPRIS